MTCPRLNVRIETKKTIDNFTKDQIFLGVVFSCLNGISTYDCQLCCGCLVSDGTCDKIENDRLRSRRPNWTRQRVAIRKCLLGRQAALRNRTCKTNFCVSLFCLSALIVWNCRYSYPNEASHPLSKCQN